MNKHQIFQTAILALLTVTVSASEVTLPNEFVAGERARAGEVNDNFTAVKTAVDNNHDRITSLEDQVKETGAVSLSVHAFGNFLFDNASGCEFRRSVNYGFFAFGTSCSATASVALPHGATITGVACLVYDNETTPSVSLNLVRAPLASEASGIQLFTAISNASSAGAQLYNLSNATSPGDDVVDNTAYSYYMSVAFNVSGLVTNTNLRIYNCKVDYTLAD
jgi:hypothetical protein